MDNRSVDIRQLECLQMLVSERHVTKAADRLGMSQPKLSSTLARLRSITGDPLLVRTPHGMTTTALAEGIADAAREFLQQWDVLVQRDPEFSSRTSSRLFRIQIPDIYTHDLFPEIMRNLRKEGPGVRISQSWQAYGKMRELLETGELDLAVGWFPQASPDLFISHLPSYQLCCISSLHHPRIGAELDLETFAREAHVVSTVGHSQEYSTLEQRVDSLLADCSLTRQVAGLVSSTASIPDIVARTDLIATLPLPIAKLKQASLPIRIFPTPVALPQIDFSMLWHARTNNDAALQWLRGIIRTSAAAAMA